MSTITKGTILSNTNNQRYGYSFDSIYNTMLKPQIYGEYLKYYGKAVGLLEWLYLAGQTVNVAGSSKTVWEEGSLTKLVEIVGDIAVAAAGANITFHLAGGEYDINHARYLNINDIIVIPAEYIEEGGDPATIPHLYQVTAEDLNVDAAKTYTATPLLITTELAVVVPDGTELMVTGGNYALESGSGGVKSSAWYARTFYNSIKKHDWAIGGGTQSNQRYYEELRGGGTGILTKLTMEADYFLDKYINDDIFLGLGVTNAAVLHMHNRNGVAVPVTGTVGVLRHLEQRAMRQYYTAAYQMTDFDDIKDLEQSQGITDRNVAFLMGSSLYKQIENSGLDFIKEFSGGTDFLENLNTIGVAFKYINKNGVYTTFKELPSLSDPTAYGAEAFNDYFVDFGMIIPEVDVTVRGSMESEASVKLRNLTLGFKNYNGENRTRIVKDIPSVASQGNIAVDTWDDSRGTMLTEYCLIFNKVNQCIMVQNDNIL